MGGTIGIGPCAPTPVALSNIAQKASQTFFRAMSNSLSASQQMIAPEMADYAFRVPSAKTAKSHHTFRTIRIDVQGFKPGKASSDSPNHPINP